MDAFQVVCTACTQNYGPCLTHCQARINQIDASDICTGNLSASGVLKTPLALIQNLSVSNLTAAQIIGTPSIPSATLGTAAYSLTPDAVVLNGQEMQPMVFSQTGAVPLNLANGSTILMGVVVSSTFVLDWRCNPGTFYFFYNSGSSDSSLALSAPGTINSTTHGSAATYAVVANERGVIFNIGPSYWVILSSS